MLDETINANTIQDLKIATYSSIENLDTEWNSILPENHHLHSNNLSFIEKSTGIKPYYLLLKSEDETIGLIYLQQFCLKKEDIDFSVLSKSYWACILSSLLGFKINVLICGNLFRQNFTSYYFKNPEDKKLLFGILEKNIDSISPEKNCGILIKDCCENLKNYSNSKHDFQQLNKDISMQMELNPAWASLNDYGNDLNKKYRKRLEKILLSAQEITVRELNSDKLVVFKNEIYLLHENVVSNQQVKIGRINEDYFIEMKKSLGNNCKVFGFFFEEKLIGFSSHIHNEFNHLELHYIGLNYDFNEKYNLYFNILYHGLQTAIENKNSKIELGRTAFVAKASMGAKAQQTNNYMLIKSGIARIAFDYMLKNYLPKNQSEILDRNPLKND